MSIYAVETALWHISGKPESAAAFRDDADGFLSGYLLDDAEKSMIKQMDVRVMADKNISTLLLLMAWLGSKGPDAMPEYMQRMNTPASG